MYLFQTEIIECIKYRDFDSYEVNVALQKGGQTILTMASRFWKSLDRPLVIHTTTFMHGRSYF